MTTSFYPQQGTPEKQVTSTLLIVDDQPGAREVLRGLLAGYGYQLAFASNGQEALAKAVEITPDLIMLDVMMPGMDGFKVCRSLRSHSLLAAVPIILLTALDDRASRIQGIQAGADDFISKPFDPAELLARVQTITQLNRYRRLHEERAKFEWVVENADDGYLVLGEADNLLYANRQACYYLGLPFEEAQPVSKTFLELAGQQYYCQPQEAWQNWPECAANEGPLYLIRRTSATENSQWLQVERMKVTSYQGGYVIRLRDITAKMTVKKQMWTFHAQVCHKLRTPITLVTGFLDFLRGEAVECLDERKETLSVIYRNALRLQDEIQDVLQYLETPDISRPFPEACNVGHIRDMVCKIKTELTLKQSMEIYLNITALEEVSLPLSPRAMELILWELLENTYKFHPRQTPTVEIHVVDASGCICIQVCDDGLSLSPDLLSKIWMPYYQGEEYFTGQVAGMGLGLSTVASLIWEAGGTCRSYNRPEGPGLVIELVVPYNEEQRV